MQDRPLQPSGQSGHNKMSQMGFTLQLGRMVLHEAFVIKDLELTPRILGPELQRSRCQLHSD